jgi:hypothetical protein
MKVSCRVYVEGRARRTEAAIGFAVLAERGGHFLGAGDAAVLRHKGLACGNLTQDQAAIRNRIAEWGRLEPSRLNTPEALGAASGVARVAISSTSKYLGVFMQLFHIIEDGAVILRCKGLFLQAKVFRRATGVYAAFGAGFIRLTIGGGTTYPTVSWIDLEASEVTQSLTSAPKFVGAADQFEGLIGGRAE